MNSYPCRKSIVVNFLEITGSPGCYLGVHLLLLAFFTPNLWRRRARDAALGMR